MPRSPSRSRRRGARARQTASASLAFALLALGLAGPVPAALGAEPGYGDEPVPCEPIGAEAASAEPVPAALAEPGLAPSRRAPPEDAGGIVSLAVAPLPPRSGAAAGEALLALPRRADGRVDDDFELAPGARVAESFWSPVLCATVVRIVAPPDRPPESLVARKPRDAVAVPNDVYASAATEVRPLEAEAPDPHRDLQWGLARSGALRARAVTDGRGARIALLDSAPDARHRDLAGIRVVAPPPTTGGGGAAAPAAPATHGSLMAGAMQAVEGNGFGIAGIAPGADVVAVPVCVPLGASAADECRLFELLRGVDTAFAERAQVLNLSLVGPPNPLLRRAMDRLEQLGVIAVAAAGNEGVAAPRYPAAYASVIGVGAIDADGRPYARGNRGPSAELLAPGVEVLSTVPGDAFAFGDGTSLAAAHASAVLALAVAASGDPAAARAAFFAAAQAGSPGPGSEPPGLPEACDVLARLARPCP